jgi:hypothetical protein
MFCAKASMQEKTSWVVDVVPYAAKMKRNTAEMTVEPARVPRRPKKGDEWSTR